MTREEMIQILALLKAAYPNSYRGMTREEGNMVIALWMAHFSNLPGDIVMLAVNNLISTMMFPPSIAEVNKSLRALYWKTCFALKSDSGRLTPSERLKAELIMSCCSDYRMYDLSRAGNRKEIHTGNVSH